MYRTAERAKIPAKSTDKDYQVMIVGNIDYIILLCVIILVMFGIIMVFSSSYYNQALSIIRNPDENINLYGNLIRQAAYAAIGVLPMLFMMNFNYRNLRNYAMLMYIGSVVLLVLVLFIGREVHGATRWIAVAGFQFQPSEFSKMSLIILFAYFLDKHKGMLQGLGGYIFLTILILIPSVLIFLQPNVSIVIVMLAIGYGMIFIVSPYTKVFIFGAAGAAGAFIYYLTFLSDSFRNARILAWFDPFQYAESTGWQVVQSLYAIASGGLFGLGLGQSRQKLGFIPETETDIIFSIVAEELGFFGAAIILILFATVIWRGIRIAINAQDTFGSLLAAGIVLVIGVQTIINVSVITNTIPNTGVPLPFISAGGTSLIVFMTLTGILLNISRYSKG